MSADVHGFERAALEPEIGVIEVDPDTGEIPVVVINRAQSHRKAMQAIKAWRERLVLPAPLLAIFDLAKEYPLGVAVGAGAAAVVTATSVSVAAIPFPERPPPAMIITERLEAIQTKGGGTPFTAVRPSTAPPTSPPRRPTARRPAVPAPTSRPPFSPAASPAASPSAPPTPTLTSTLMPEPAKSPASSTRPQATASPSPPSAASLSPPGEERSKQGESESSESPSAKPSPQKPTLLPPIDIDVPLIDEDPLVDAVCGLLPIGCPIG